MWSILQGGIYVINNVNSNPASRFFNHTKQAENRTRNESKRASISVSDRIEISDKARAALKASRKEGKDQGCCPDAKEDPIEEFLEEYNRTSKVGLFDEPNDAAAAARMKLAAIRIAMRISNGDNVPMQDHRFLAEYDSALYKAAMQASLVADNDNPKKYDSLVDEMSAAENGAASLEGENSGLDTEEAAMDAAEDLADSAEYD